MIDDPVVFVVDDDPSVRRSLARLLKALGFQTETFASAWEFLAREPFEGPSCLLVDVRMPELSGFDLFERLKATRREVPVIFITGHGDIPMAVRAIKAGAVDFLAKPFDEEALVAAVQQAIGESRERAQPVVEVPRRTETGEAPADQGARSENIGRYSSDEQR